MLLAIGGVEGSELLRDFAIIMALAGAVVVVFRKLNQPPILGYLLAGLIVGPYTLPNPPVTDAGIIHLLADLGLVLLLFTIGLEFGWRRIREVGLGVLFIGAFEILTMISLGYLLGQLMNWSGQESLFLGAAMSISSSAILFKVLSDTRRLTSAAGRIVVGILVVEDFAAVVLLTLLAGLATTGTEAPGLAEIGTLMMKLALFAVASLSLGALVVPRIIRFVAGVGSREAVLLVSLALCFSLALLGQTLEMSAAAGAFLIGAVVGDTDESHEISSVIEPVRDVLGALFFVSIGMLIDVRVVLNNIIPALVVSAVFMVGKIVAGTTGVFLAGRGGRQPVSVGLRMPQMGEFSLAMMKIGVEQQAISAFIYHVIAGVTMITALIYPYIARSADGAARLAGERSPNFVQNWFLTISSAIAAFRAGLAFDNEFARRVRHAAIPIGLNLLIIVVLLATGAFVARYTDDLAGVLPLSRQIVGNIIGLGALALCIPFVVALWRELGHFADDVADYLLSRSPRFRTWVPEALHQVGRDFTRALLMLFIVVWSLPLITNLLSLGSLAAPLPLAMLALMTILAFLAVARIQRQLMHSLGHTFLGQELRLALLERHPETPEGEEAPPTRRTFTDVYVEAQGPAERLPERRRRNDGGRGGPLRGRRRLVVRAGVYTAVLGLLAAGWSAGYILTNGEVWWFL